MTEKDSQLEPWKSGQHVDEREALNELLLREPLALLLGL